jgi:hypothetical protein
MFIARRRQAELDSVVLLIGKNVTAVQGDVAKLEDLDRLYEVVRKMKGRVDRRRRSCLTRRIDAGNVLTSAST